MLWTISVPAFSGGYENILILYHFTTSVFTTSLPSGRPPTLSRCFKCQQGRVPYTHFFESLKTKNPRVSNPGVLKVCCVFCYTTVLRTPILISGVRSNDRLLFADQEAGIKPPCWAIEQ